MIQTSASTSSGAEALTAEPLGAAERLDSVDVLRGFALLGILLINLQAFKGAAGPPGLGFEGSAADLWALRGLVLLVESKFFTLFSFLFGLGFAIQLLRAQARGVAFAPRFRRRLAGLLVFGALHVLLLWEGDILMLYALAGALLLGFRDTPPRRLLAWVRGLLAVPLMVLTLGFTALLVARTLPGPAAALGGADAELLKLFREAAAENRVLYAGAAYLDLMLRRLLGYAEVLPLLLSRLPTVLAMFLLGLWAGRVGVLRDSGAHLGLLRRVRGWGLTLGLGISALIVWGQAALGPVVGLVALLFNQALAGPLLALGYGAALLLALHARPRVPLAAPVGALGRMALSNYLGQSLVAALIFSPFGLGWYGQVSPLEALGLGLLIYAGQLGLSVLWLRRFRFGPLEWLWRSWTYGRWQPLRRTG